VAAVETQFHGLQRWQSVPTVRHEDYLCAVAAVAPQTVAPVAVAVAVAVAAAAVVALRPVPSVSVGLLCDPGAWRSFAFASSESLVSTAVTSPLCVIKMPAPQTAIIRDRGTPRQRVSRPAQSPYTTPPGALRATTQRPARRSSGGERGQLSPEGKRIFINAWHHERRASTSSCFSCMISSCMSA
jgi:hypothetical protein